MISAGKVTMIDVVSKFIDVDKLLFRSLSLFSSKRYGLINKIVDTNIGKTSSKKAPRAITLGMPYKIKPNEPTIPRIRVCLINEEVFISFHTERYGYATEKAKNAFAKAAI